MPPSDLEALLAFVGALNNFVNLAKDASESGRAILGDPDLQPHADVLLQTIKERRESALVAGVHVHETRVNMDYVLKQAIDACIDHRVWEATGGSNLLPYPRLIDALRLPLATLKDLTAIAASRKHTSQPTPRLAAPPSPKTRRTRKRAPAPLTKEQREAYTLVERHDGNFTSAAKEAGVTRQAITKLYRKACEKIGEAVGKKDKPKTQRLPSDSRGQAYVADRPDSDEAE